MWKKEKGQKGELRKNDKERDNTTSNLPTIKETTKITNYTYMTPTHGSTHNPHPLCIHTP